MLPKLQRNLKNYKGMAHRYLLGKLAVQQKHLHPADSSFWSHRQTGVAFSGVANKVIGQCQLYMA